VGIRTWVHIRRIKDFEETNLKIKAAPYLGIPQ
jgi:hypothetical protein